MASHNSALKQPAIRPVHMGLFPTMDSLESVVDLGLSQLPINNANALFSILATYHNTILHVQSKAQEN